MSSKSNVGDSSTYEAGDQRKYKEEELREAEREGRFHEGQANAHLANDSKDERTIANKLEREAKREKESEKEKTLEDLQAKIDPTLPAKAKGNEPSKGAKIDKEIQDEEEEILKKKGAFGPKDS